MAKTTNEITTKFSADVRDLKAGIQEAKAQIRLANAEFKAASTAIGYMADSSEGLQAKVTQLSKVYEAQDKILAAYKAELEKVVAEQGENSKAAIKLKTDIANQQAAVNKTAQELETYRKKLDAVEKEQKDGTAANKEAAKSYEELKKAIKDQEDRLGDLKDRYAAVVAQQGKNSKAAKDLAKEITDLSGDLKASKDAMKAAESAADDLDQSLGTAGKAAKEADGGFTVLKATLADLAATAIKKVVEGLKDVAKASYDAWKSFDDGADNVIKATGATGEMADSLTQSLGKVSKQIVGDFGTLGSVLGEVNTRFGYTEDDLEKATIAFQKFSEITGQDAVSAVQDVARALESSGTPLSEYQHILDAVAVTAQASGISSAKLTEGINKYGSAMRAVGFSLDDTISLMAQFEKSGVNAEQAFGGITKAAASWIKAGEDPAERLQAYVAAIKRTTDEARAGELAIEAFGAKAGVELSDAIRSNRLEFSAFSDEIKNSEGAVERTFASTQDLPDEVALAMQSLKVDAAQALGDLMTEVGPELSEIIHELTDLAANAIPEIKGFFEFLIKNKDVIAGFFTVIATGFAAFKITGLITSLVTAFQGLFAALAAGEGIMSALNITMSANPIGLVAAAVAGLTAAVIYLWNNSEDFRNFWIGAWENIQKAAKSAWDGIKSAFSGVKSFFENTFEGAAEAVELIMDGLVGVVKAPINFLIDGLNSFIKGLNKIQIPDWVVGIGGYGINIPLIPRLESGGVLKKGQLGLLEGNGAEAVVPLDKNRAWIAAVAKELRREVSGGEAAQMQAAPSYVFNQYNNSPKALSRLEIYQQTQRQIELMKGV